MHKNNSNHVPFTYKFGINAQTIYIAMFLSLIMRHQCQTQTISGSKQRIWLTIKVFIVWVNKILTQQKCIDIGEKRTFLQDNFLNSSTFRNAPYSLYTRKPSCRWQTRATLAKRLHGLRKSSGVASLPIDSVPMVSYDVLYSNCVYKKAQLSLTNPRDACEMFARFT